MDRITRTNMRRDRRDYARGRARNPYGSEGGYVRDYRRNDYNMHDYSRISDYARDDMHGNDVDRMFDRNREYYGAYGNTPFYIRSGEDYSRSNYGHGDYGRMRDYNIGDYARGYRNDYGLEDEDINDWVEKLLVELDPEEREIFKMDKVIKKAEEMGEKFDKYSEKELYIATLMTYTDYKNRIGKNNVDVAIGMGKDFLCDPDTKVKYGDKLATYYDCIVMGE